MDKTVYGETEYLLEPFYGWNFDIINSDEIGKTLVGRYKIIKLLGKGNNSKVLLVEDLEDKKNVVIKLMLKKELEEVLINEYNILKELDEEGIIRSFSYEKATSVEPALLTFEFVDGKSLKELFYENSLDKITLLEMFLKLAYTLKYVHEKSIIHSDIKPENILISKTNKVKLIDFGIAMKSYEKDKGFGTLKYMSPERLLKEEFDIRTDIYSYFLTLYEGLNEEYPFIGGDLKKRIITEKIKEFKNCDILIKRFLSRGLEKEPYLRFEDFSAVIEELKDLIFFEKDIIPFLGENNRGSLTSHALLNNKNIEKFDFYFDLLFFERGQKSLIEGNYSRVKFFIFDYVRNMQYNIEDNFKFGDFFNIVNRIFSDLDYEKLRIYTENEIQIFINKKEKELKQINDRAILVLGNKDYKMALKEFRIAAKQGSGLAYYEIGNIYERGLGVSIDNKKALENFSKSKKMNYPKAINKLGEFYFNGGLLGKNHDEAFRLFKLASEMGEINSQRALGQCYKFGYGVAVDYELSYLWFKRAYDNGDLLSGASLGYLLDNGLGMEKNLEKAFFYYTKAAELGDIYSLLSLGSMYSKGLGTKKDYKEAFKVFEKAAYAGNDKAQYYVGEYYYEGRAGEQSFEKGVFWLEKSAEKDNEEALNKLGKIFEEKDYEKAIEYYQRALSKHNVEANFNIAMLYLSLPEMDIQKVIKYLNRAGEAGKIEAYYRIGKIYQEGTFLRTDIKEAKKYFEKAAEKDYALAQLELGKFYLGGNGFVQNYPKAFELIEAASKAGVVEAMGILGSLYENGQGTYKNLAEAEKWKKLGNQEIVTEIKDEKQSFFTKISKIFVR